jgi:hypothetical protein
VIHQVQQLVVPVVRIDRDDTHAEAVERQVVEEELRPVVEEQADPMSVAIAGVGVAGLALEHALSRLRVRQLDAVRMIGAPLGGRHAQERIVRRRRRRGHERGEYRPLLAHPFCAWPALISASAAVRA